MNYLTLPYSTLLSHLRWLPVSTTALAGIASLDKQGHDPAAVPVLAGVDSVSF